MGNTLTILKTNQRTTAQVISTPIDVIDCDSALSIIMSWAKNRESRYVCMCNVHSVVTAKQDSNFGTVLKNADMATPDGAPVAWLIRKFGYAQQIRVNGPDLMWKYCKISQSKAINLSESNGGMFFYGSTETTLATLQANLLTNFPNLNIAGAVSPPFRTLTPDEDAIIVAKINNSGAGIVWVSLGCPKQELWMAAHRGRINAVMVGVGAAFDYHAGTIKRAPKWMQNNGLEWLYRFVSEPRRLWKRYLMTNSLFVIWSLWQCLFFKKRRLSGDTYQGLDRRRN